MANLEKKLDLTIANKYNGKDLAPDLNITTYLSTLSESDDTETQEPFICPKCGRPFRKLILFEVHLESFDHNNPPEGYDPTDMDWKPKKRQERLKELEEKVRNDSGSESGQVTPARISHQKTPGRTPGSRRGRVNWGSNRKRKAQFRRGSDVTEGTPNKTRVRVDQHGNITTDNLTWAEAQRLVEVEDEQSNKIYRVSIFDEMDLCEPEPDRTYEKIASGDRVPVPDTVIIESSPPENQRIHKMPTEYIKYNGPNEQGIEYDMDEEDHVWLEIINENREQHGFKVVNPDQFEGVMDRLEKDSILETNKPQKTPREIDDEAVCCVCNDGECTNSNAILFCDLCNLAVHQECYGVPYIPEGQWLCRRCQFSPSKAVDCVLCPNLHGAFKQTVDNKWCHVVCALWVPEVNFQNPSFLEPIDGFKNVPPARWKLKCYICKSTVAGKGACIQCHKQNCYTAFHVTCAQSAGLYMDMRVEKGDGINGIITASVIKTAFCHCHIPKDWSPRPLKSCERLPSSREALMEAQVNEAREAIGKHNNQLISKPYIPSDRIPNLLSLHLPPYLGQAALFFQRSLSYWSQKRQIRNGVPLIRRLQNSVQKGDKNEGSNDDEKRKLKEQLRYWQRLRHDLERARLLIELIKKREKLKMSSLNKAKQICILKMNPFMVFLRDVLHDLHKLDTMGIFQRPVTDKEAPMYSTIIKTPMDLGTMAKKVDNLRYSSFAEFEFDVDLIAKNCMHYNGAATIFYKIGKDLQMKATPILKSARKLVCQYNTKTGQHLLPGESPSNDAEIEFHRRHVQKLESKLRKVESEKVSSKRTKDIKKFRIEISTIRRKLRNLGVDISDHEPTKSENAVDSGTETEPLETTNGHLHNGPSLNGSSNVSPSSSSGIGVDRPDDYGNSNGNAHKNGIEDELDLKEIEENNRVADPLLKERKNHLNGPKIEENGNIPHASDHSDREDLQEDVEESLKENGEKYLKKRKIHAEDTSCSDLQDFRPLDLVWAKCKGYPWYPALIVNPELAADEPLTHGDEELPQPTQEVIEMGSQYNCNEKGDVHHLVLFFDQRRTWQWLPKNKIALLGKDKKFDHLKLNEGKTTAQRKSVERAFNCARQPHCPE